MRITSLFTGLLLTEGVASLSSKKWQREGYVLLPPMQPRRMRPVLPVCQPLPQQ